MLKSKQSLLLIVSVAFLSLLTGGCGKTDHRALMPQTNETTLDQTVILGIQINTVSELMTTHGFSETMLQIESFDVESSLKMWHVGEGTLIVSYRTTDSIVTDLEFHLSTRGLKELRQSFSLSVNRFVPATGEMTTTISWPNGNAG